MTEKPEMDHPHDMTRPEVTAFYRRQSDLFNAYRTRLAEAHAAHDGPITEVNVAFRMGGLSTFDLARQALADIGRPTDDRLTIEMAHCYVEKLERQIDEVAIADPEPTIESAARDYWLYFMGCVPTVETWHDMTEEQQHERAWGLLNTLEDYPDVAAHAFRLAMPHLLRAVIEADKRRRNPLRVVTDEDGGRA